jgi:phenylalanine-4-hydroxylase
MVTLSEKVTRPEYNEQDHQTWAALCARQVALVGEVACAEFLEGFPALGLDLSYLPDPAVISGRLRGLTGWTLGDAQNAYLGPTEWFEHLAARRFPVTDYIRKPHELDFTPLPDLFHEYFGHLAYFTGQYFADTAQMFGDLYLTARDERQQLEIARLWWFTTEFGLIRHDGQLKVYGAGLLSSPGELLHALNPDTPKHPFDIRQEVATPGAAYSMHPAYFILDDPGHTRRIIQDYARMEGLPIPQPPG